jgi:hypothetical protein
VLRHRVPVIVVLGLLGCGAITELPDGPDEHDGTLGTGGSMVGDGDGDVRLADAGPLPKIPPTIEVCFAAGTPIATPGGEQPIEIIEVGDLVWAFDVERDVRVVARVSAVHRHEDAAVGRLTTGDGRTLRATPNHPIYVRERAGFVAANEIQGGETLVQLDDAGEVGTATVSASAFVADVTREPVFNLTVEGVHTYFAGGLLVHNKQPDPQCHYPYQSNGFVCVLSPEACFAPGTSVATPSGERAIEALSVGDVVWGYDVERDARVASRVSAVHAHEAREVGAVVLGDGRVLYATQAHPFYDASLDRYVPAADLSAESRLLSVEDGARTLSSAEFVPGATHSIVHNITVEGVHNYFAGGVLVHNKEAPPCPTYDWGTGTGCEHPVVGRGPDCALYPTPALSAEQYATRINEALFSVHDAGGSPVTLPPNAITEGTTGDPIQHRNITLNALFGAPAAFELGSTLATWLRVPVPIAPSASSSIEGQLYWQLAMNLGKLVTRPEGATVVELLTYPGSVMTPELAALYGIFDTGQAVDALLPPERRGVLTEIAFLRANPTPSDRGRVLDELFNCGVWQDHLPPMPSPIVFSTRYDAYENIDTIAGCAECHGEIDRMGLPLEHFDELGAHRLEENGFAVTPLGVAAEMDVEGAHQLSAALATLPADCVARSLLASVLKRALGPDDFCSIDWVLAGMQSRGDLRGALLSAITSPAFRHATAGAPPPVAP